MPVFYEWSSIKSFSESRIGNADVDLYAPPLVLDTSATTPLRPDAAAAAAVDRWDPARRAKSLAFLGSKETSVENVESGELDRTEDNQVESDKDQGDKPH